MERSSSSGKRARLALLLRSRMLGRLQTAAFYGQPVSNPSLENLCRHEGVFILGGVIYPRGQGKG